MHIMQIKVKGMAKPMLMLRPTVTMLRKELAAFPECDWRLLDTWGMGVEASGANDWPPIEQPSEYIVNISRGLVFA